MRQPDFTRRVVVTGLGVVSPVGNDKATAWNNLVNGLSGLERDHQVRSSPLRPQVGRRGPRLRAPPTGWTPRPSAAASRPCGTASRPPSRRSRTRASRSPTRTARTSASCSARGAGGQTLMLDNWAGAPGEGPQPRRPDVHRQRPRRLAPRGMIAIETGAIGHNICVVTACSTGTNCVGEAAEIIRRGDVHTVIAGSSEMPLLEVAHAGSATCAGSARPARASRIADISRPFDRTRDGFVLGEGGGGLILEDLEMREGPRRAHLRRGRGLRLRRRRLGHDPADRARHPAPPGRCAAALERRGVPGRRGRRDQPARHLDPGRRQARGRGDLDRVRRPRRRRRPREPRDQRHQVDDRPHDGRGRRVRGVRDGHDRRRAVRPGDDQLLGVRPRGRRLGRPRDPRRWPSATRCPTTSAWAATTARSSSSAGTAAEPPPAPSGPVLGIRQLRARQVAGIGVAGP